MDMIAATETLIQSIKMINFNLDRLNQTTEKICNRLDVLENDYRERSLRKKFYRSLIAIYPAIMVCLLWFIGLDHQKVSQAVSDVNLLVQDMKGLTMYAFNDNDN